MSDNFKHLPGNFPPCPICKVCLMCIQFKYSEHDKEIHDGKALPKVHDVLEENR